MSHDGNQAFTATWLKIIFFPISLLGELILNVFSVNLKNSLNLILSNIYTIQRNIAVGEISPIQSFLVGYTTT